MYFNWYTFVFHYVPRKWHVVVRLFVALNYFLVEPVFHYILSIHNANIIWIKAKRPPLAFVHIPHNNFP